MMKLTLFSTGETCHELGQVKITHVCLFEKDLMSLSFISDEDQMKCIALLIKHYVKFICQGTVVSINPNDFMRVRYRFDSIIYNNGKES